MRKLILALAVLAAALTACRTTEQNYRAAYEKAVEKQNEGLTTEERLAMEREEAMPKSVYRGDSIPLKAMWVNTVAGTSETAAREYNVVTAAFTQRFNANSAMTRLRDGGYPGALLLVDADQRFYVAAVTTASLDSALTALETLRAESPIALRAPYPYILRRASRR